MNVSEWGRYSVADFFATIAVFGGIKAYVAVAAVIFVMAFCSLWANAKNIISVLIAIEIMLLTAGFNFAAFSSFMNDISGQIFAIVVLAVVAAKASVGMALIMSLYRRNACIDVEDINLMRG